MEETIINKILNRKTKRPQSNLKNNYTFNIKQKRPKLIQKKFKRKKRLSSKYYLTQKNIINNQSTNNHLKLITQIRKNAIFNFIKIFKGNEDLIEQGDLFINDLANKLENELFKIHPAIGINYKKCLNNMNKTLKEIIKNKTLSELIINNDIDLFQISIIPYGEELTKKIKKIISQHKNKNNSDSKIILLQHLYEPLSLNKIYYKFFYPISYEVKYNSTQELIDKEKYIEMKAGNTNISKKIEFKPKIKNEEIQLNLNISNKKNKNEILRIYHGKIKLNHIYINNISLFSINSIEKFKKFPSFGEILKLTSKVEISKIIPYCIKHLNDKRRIQLFGWLEPDLDNKTKEEKIKELEKFINLINEYDKEDKCSSLKNEKIKLYIFVLKKADEYFNKKIIDEISFTNNLVKERLEKEKKYLVFALISNIDFLNKKRIREKDKINPEIINKYSKKEKNKVENNDEDNKNLKELLSQKDFDIHSWMKKNYGKLSEEEKYNEIEKLNKDNRDKILELIYKSREKNKEEMNNNKSNNIKIVNNTFDFNNIFGALSNNDKIIQICDKK